MRLLRPLSLAVFALSIPVVISAQGGRGGGEPPKNLQVLPKDMPRNQVTAIMRTFAMALGVRCEHCHAPAAAAANPDTAPAGRGGRGGGGPQLDYSLDDKETKKVAREMIKMVNDINGKYLPLTGRTFTDLTRVTCEWRVRTGRRRLAPISTAFWTM